MFFFLLYILENSIFLVFGPVVIQNRTFEDIFDYGLTFAFTNFKHCINAIHLKKKLQMN